MFKKKFLPENDTSYAGTPSRLLFFRVLAVTTCLVGVNYIIWRIFFSLNFQALWFSVALLVAEVYSFIDLLFFAFMMWKPKKRVSQEPFETSVDVFITTYNEPLELVQFTAKAARQIEWRDMNVYILDDGARPVFKEMAEQLGCGYIVRGNEWKGKQRHAKAGNVNNALMQTTGEFILILDTDQIPKPDIIQKCIGYFTDPAVAFVQTPQSFYNLLPGDPFGSDAPLFYGPILTGKDGWNAAFFCGSNAILRREALMQLGLVEYVRKTEEQINQGIKSLENDLQKIDKKNHDYHNVIKALEQKIDQIKKGKETGVSLEVINQTLLEAIQEAQVVISEQEIQGIADTLAGLSSIDADLSREVRDYLINEKGKIVRELNQSPESIGISEKTIKNLDLLRTNEAQPILPLATISITEDMATAMRLHAAGWKSVYHPQTLAFGLAPEDLGSALSQRLRWAQGTIQVLVRENPLFLKGLSFPQRISYFTTIYSYFSGFFNLIFLLAPIIYLFTGLAPVSAWSWEFIIRLIPLLLLNKILFRIVAGKIPVVRGEQYSLGLFSLWIQAVISVLIGKKLGFVVTPKQRQSGNFLPLVWPQIMIIFFTFLSIIYCSWAFYNGHEYQWSGIIINVFWGIYNAVMLSAIVKASVYKPPPGWKVHVPDFANQ